MSVNRILGMMPTSATDTHASAVAEVLSQTFSNGVGQLIENCWRACPGQQIYLLVADVRLPIVRDLMDYMGPELHQWVPEAAEMRAAGEAASRDKESEPVLWAMVTLRRGGHEAARFIAKNEAQIQAVCDQITAQFVAVVVIREGMFVLPLDQFAGGAVCEH
jgi:hypothetical protein